LRIWRDRGFIDCQTKDDRRLVKQIRVDGERKYLICIKRDALEFPVEIQRRKKKRKTG